VIVFLLRMGHIDRQEEEDEEEGGVDAAAAVVLVVAVAAVVTVTGKLRVAVPCRRVPWERSRGVDAVKAAAAAAAVDTAPLPAVAAAAAAATLQPREVVVLAATNTTTETVQKERVEAENFMVFGEGCRDRAPQQTECRVLREADTTIGARAQECAMDTPPHHAYLHQQQHMRGRRRIHNHAQPQLRMGTQVRGTTSKIFGILWTSATHTKWCLWSPR
jgi:hypothetical protein